MARYAQTFDALLTSQRAGGVTLAGGKAWFYVPGSVTLKAIYADRNKQTPLTNPVTLSADGTAQVFGDGLYDVKITNSAGVQKFFWEDVKIQDAASDSFNYLLSDYASLSAAVAAIGAVNTAGLDIDTDTTVSADLTVTPNIHISVPAGKLITIAAGKTLTLPAPDAGTYQIFSGTGTVIITSGDTAYADWWGDYTTTTAPIQKAINAYRSVTLTKSCTPDAAIYVDKSFFVLNANYVTFDMSNKNFPLINIGVKSNGLVSDETRSDITIKELNITSDLLYGYSGTHGVRFGRTSNSRVVNSHIYGVQYGISSMTKDYSLGATINNCDLRGNNYGVYDPNGAFQGGAIIAGRIEQNKYNGIYTKSDNWTLSTVIIEGNGGGGISAEDKAEIWAGQNAALSLNNVYTETIHASQPIIYVPTSATAATMIHINGGYFYGKSGESTGELIRVANTASEQSYSIRGANVRNMAKIINVTTPNTGIYAHIVVDDRSSAIDPTSGLIGCTYVVWSKTYGLQVNNLGSASSYIPGTFSTYFFARDYLHLQPVNPTTTTITNGSLFVDSTNSNKLSYRDYSGALHTINLTP